MKVGDLRCEENIFDPLDVWGDDGFGVVLFVLSVCDLFCYNEVPVFSFYAQECGLELVCSKLSKMELLIIIMFGVPLK